MFGTELRARLSTAWIAVTLNYLYCDVVGLMDPNLLRQFAKGRVNGMDVSTGFLLGASVLMEIPMAMVIASRLLPDRVNRWANVLAGGLMTLVQAASLLAGRPAPWYLFFSAVEIAGTALIASLAWRTRAERIQG